MRYVTLFYHFAKNALIIVREVGPIQLSIAARLFSIIFPSVFAFAFSYILANKQHERLLRIIVNTNHVPAYIFALKRNQLIKHGFDALDPHIVFCVLIGFEVYLEVFQQSSNV